MSITPDEVISDLIHYLDLYNINLSKEAKKTFKDIEEFGFKCNYPCKAILFFSKLIRNTKELQKLLYRHKLNPSLAALILEMGYYNSLDTNTNYQKGTKLYSYIHDRDRHDKLVILDKAIQNCVKEERTILENRDILLAVIDYFEKYIAENPKLYSEIELKSGNFTLAHVYGKYNENLLLGFDEMREYMVKCESKILSMRWS